MIRLIGAVLALACSWFGAQPLVGTDAALVSFAYSHGGMSADQIYAYSVRAEDGRLLADFELYCRDEIRDVPLEEEDAAALRALVDGLWPWNGFAGSNADVLDGESFSLSAEFEDGAQLTASGTNAFPEGYPAGAAAIRAYFEGLMEKHGVSAGPDEDF